MGDNNSDAEGAINELDIHVTHDGMYHFLKRLIEQKKVPPGLPLVIFDYHNDYSISKEDLAGYKRIDQGNWVGFAESEGLVGPVYWVRPRHGFLNTSGYLDGYAKVVDDISEIPGESLQSGVVLSLDADYFITNSGVLGATEKDPSAEELKEELAKIRNSLRNRNIPIMAVGVAESPTYSYAYKFPYLVKAVMGTWKFRKKTSSDGNVSMSGPDDTPTAPAPVPDKSGIHFDAIKGNKHDQNDSGGSLHLGGQELPDTVFDEQLLDQFKMLRAVYNENMKNMTEERKKRLGITKYNLRKSIPEFGKNRILSETEADLAAVFRGLISVEQFGRLAELRRLIKGTGEYKKAVETSFTNIPIYFVPTTGTELFWVDGKGYAAHSKATDGGENRIHISLPLALHDARLSAAAVRNELYHIEQKEPDPSLDRRIQEVAERDMERKKIAQPDIVFKPVQLDHEKYDLSMKISNPVYVTDPLADIHELYQLLQSQGQWRSVAVTVDNLPSDLRGLLQQILMISMNGETLSALDMLEASTEAIIFAPLFMTYENTGYKHQSSADVLTMSPASVPNDLLPGRQHVMVISTLNPSDAILTGERIHEKNIYE
jgi:hypothetical protein